MLLPYTVPLVLITPDPASMLPPVTLPPADKYVILIAPYVLAPSMLLVNVPENTPVVP